MLKAAFWSTIDKVSFQLINLTVSIIIARYLGPNQLATVAIIAGYVYFLNIFVDSGLTISIIRNKNISPKEISAIFYFNLFVSVFFILLTLLTSNLVEQYFKINNLSFYLNISSLILLFNSFCFVRYAIMEQKMEFKLLSYINLGSIIFSGTICVLMLIEGYGIISAILFSIISAIIRNILFLIFTPKFKILPFDFQVLKPHLRFGKNLLFSSSIEAIYNNGFPILITKLFTGYDAGIFFQSKRLIDGPINILSASSRRLFLPVASNLKDEPNKIFPLLLQILKFTSYILAFIIGILFLNADYIINSLLGQNWYDSIKIMQILVLGMMFYPSFFLCNDVFKVNGNSKTYSRNIVITRIISILIILLSSKLGFLAMVYSFSITQFLMFIFVSYTLSKNYGYSFIIILKAVLEFVIIMTIAVYSVYLLQIEDKTIYTLLFKNLIVFSIYLISCIIFLKYNPTQVLVDKLRKNIVNNKKA